MRGSECTKEGKCYKDKVHPLSSSAAADVGGHYAHSSPNTTGFLVVPGMELGVSATPLSREDLQIALGAAWFVFGVFFSFCGIRIEPDFTHSRPLLPTGHSPVRGY